MGETLSEPWFLSGMETVMRAPSAINLQPVMFTVDKCVITAHVSEKRTTDLVDLGIAKLHFEIASHGTFTLGNGGEFKKE